MARRTKEDADATRNGLLDAAELVFYEKGVARASLSEIAQAAGTTRGAIYWHFKDKVDLFNAMMDRVTLPLEAVSDVGEGLAPLAPLQRLRSVVDRFLTTIATDARARRVFEIAIYRVEYVNELDGVRERHLAAHTRFQHFVEQILREAADEAALTLPMDVVIAARGLHALLDGLVHSWILAGGDFDLRACGLVGMDTHLRGLGFRV